jgi:hypothetical protein
MVWQLFLHVCDHYHGICVLGAAAVVMGAAWLRVLWDYGAHAHHHAPARWYTAHAPTTMAAEHRWDLRDLNRDYTAEGLRRARADLRRRH